MAPLQTGSTFPEGVKFDWVPIEDNDPTKCGMPQEFNASQEFNGKKVVLVGVPGAFTPTCQVNHVAPFIQKGDALKSKGVDKVVIIAANDAWVMNAWGKINDVPKGDFITLMSDTKTHFGKEHGWLAGMGDRLGRWAMIIEKDGKVSYAESEKTIRDVEVSGVDAVMAKL